MERIKVYGKKVRVHTVEDGWIKADRIFFSEWDMCEISYKVYDENGAIVAVGTEDFSRERLLYANLKSAVYQLVMDTGEKYPSGNTKWDHIGTLFMQAAKSDWSKARRAVGKHFATQGIRIR